MQQIKSIYVFAFLCLLISSTSLFAQTKSSYHEVENVQFSSTTQLKGIDTPFPKVKNKRCASTEYREWQQAKYPNQILSNQDFENWMSVKSAEWKAKKSNQSVVMTIPIIFHVIHNGGAVGSGDNIATTYINAQIEQLNNDFRKIMGTSGFNTHPDGADAEIEFCAATVDPSGNTLAEPGINRVNRNTAGFSAPPYSPGYIDANIKPAFSWDPNNYYNVWVVNLGSGLLGYAQFPSNSGLTGVPAIGGGANTDGCVILHTSVGSSTTPFPGGAPYDEGRTLTHETGHWLGLIHIWGGSNCGNDFCADTPTQQTSSTGCPNTTTCDGVNDMVENYMDYSHDACMNIFTEDQKTRMMTVLTNSPRRMSLTSSTVCNTNMSCANYTLTSSSTNATCAAGGTGTATPNGGTAPYTYNWSSGGSGMTETGLAIGTYQVTVTDAANCSLTESVTINNMCAVVCDTISNYDLVNDNPVVYQSDNIGYATGHNEYGDVSKADYFDYSNGIHSDVKGAYLGFGVASASGPAATFNVTMWDGTGGTPGTILGTTTVLYQDVVNLISGGGNIAWVEFPALVTLPASKQFFLGIEFTYNALDTIALITNTDPEGNPNTAWEEWGGGGGWFAYNDANTWELDVSHLILPVLGTPPAPTITPLSSTICQNDAVNFSASGSNIDMYEWQFPGGTPATSTVANPTVTYANAGSFDVIFIAHNGCITDTTSLSNAVVVNSCGCNLTVSSSSTGETCFQNDGTATVTASGTAPYTYQWDATANNQTTATAIGLTAGTYNVTISDAASCSQVSQIIITDDCICNMTLATGTTPESCTGNDGSATVTPSNGTGPYTYQWDVPANNQTTATANNLIIGSYSVTVIDATGCAVTALATVGTSCSTGCDTISNFDFVNYNPALFNAPAPETGYLSGTNTYEDQAKADYYNYLGANSHLKGGYFYFEGLTIANPATSTVDVTAWNGTGGTPGAILGTKTVLMQDIQTFLDDAIVNGTSPLYWVEFDNYLTLPASNEFFLGFQIPTTSGDTIAVVTSNVDFTPTPPVPEAPSPGTAWELWSDGTWNTYEAGWGFPFTNLIVPVLGVDPTASFTPIQQAICIGDAIVLNNTSTDAISYEWQFPGGQPTSSTDVVPNNVVYTALGTYDITLIAHNDCMSDTLTIQGAVTVSGISPLTTSSTPATCAGNDGTATVNTPVGNGPFGYNWDAATGNQNTQTATGLSIGTYSVTVIDNAGCFDVTSVVVADGCVCNMTATVTNIDATCAGICDGMAQVSVAGATMPVVYQWDAATGNQITATALNLCAGTYTVTATDANGCSATATAFIAEPTSIITTITVDNNVLCFSGNDGFATISVTGGTPGYQYQWDAATGNQNTITANGLSAGVYFATVTDLNGCTSTNSITITEPSAIQILVNTDQDDFCGNSTGVLTANASGGTGMNYQYQWDVATGNQTTASATGLMAGSYSVTVTDINGCTEFTTGNVASISGPSTTTSATLENCGMSNGTATVVPTGGSLPYNIQWDAATGNQSTPIATGLSSGTYNVTVSDTNGCVATNSVIVADDCSGCSLTTTINGMDESCAAICDGSATAVPSNGTAPFTYAWSTLTNFTQTINNLCPGTYSVTVVDAQMCTATASITINGAVALTTATTSTNTTCAGNDGAATVNPTGGTMPYTYQWDAAAGNQTSQTAGGLGVGGYQITITDANGCTVIDQVGIADGCVCNLAATTTSTNTTCAGNDGAATVNPTGGTMPYTYQWDAAAGNQTSQTAGGLGVGGYQITITDANGCTVIDQVGIADGCICNLAATTTSTNTTCAGNDGAATVNPTGGTMPYTYQWDAAAGNQTSQTAGGLGVGGYQITITDANGCTVIDQVGIADGCVCSLTGTGSSMPESCFGNDGTATAIPTGGTMPYTYQWDAATGNQTTPIAVGLTTGTYNVLITDNMGCTTNIMVVVTNNCNCTIVASVGTTNATCGTPTGMATANPAGGTAPYTFMWSNGDVGQTISGLVPGTYFVTVSDAVGCSVVSNQTVGDSGSITAQAVGTDLTCNGDNSGSATVTNAGLVYQWSNGQSTAIITGLAAGTYDVTVSQGSCTDVTSVTITEPSALNANIIGNDNQCSQNGATANGTAFGGVQPYQYMWSTGSTMQSIGGLGSGTYMVTVTDMNGCSAIASESVISAANGPILSTTQTNITCAGANDGTVDLTVNGGTTPFTYNWNGLNIEDLSGLASGSYTCVVTDANGCVAVTTVQISEPAPMTLTFAATASSGNDGTASVNVFGGNPPYNYTWSNGDTTQTAMNLPPGTYSVIIEDANGCITQGSILIGATTNTIDLESLTNFELTPNPSNGLFSVELEFSQFEQVEFTIYNVLGQELLRMNTEGSSLSLPIDLTSEASGTYFAKVRTNKGKAVKRFIITE